MTELTVERLKTVLDERFGGVLRLGGHEGERCSVCAMELRAAALGEEWTDRPLGCEEIGWAVRTLNDADWPSDEARTKHCLRLATLSDADCADGWADRFALQIAKEVVPVALECLGWHEQAEALEAADTLPQARGVTVVAYEALTDIESAGVAHDAIRMLQAGISVAERTIFAALLVRRVTCVIGIGSGALPVACNILWECATGEAVDA